MSNQKRALVVDDSRSARLVLRRMLEKYGLLVDTIESAGQALDFLIHNRPDVIFMDHMMPGMDGFEAVKAIKNNPETATIPVMMYTSRGGDLYLGQARALGAVGVLPKTVAPAELFKSLLKIGLVTERRSEELELDEEDASERAEDLHKLAQPAPIHVAEAGLAPTGTPNSAELDQRLRRLLEEQSVELRKDVLLSLETVARQTSNRLNKELDEKLEQLTPPPPAPSPSILPVILLTGLLFVSLAWNVSLHNKDDS
ncbi:MAG TPA: response regulator, partial [Gammaproteobacteria bacterium]|nr:response regulator [Gammaproteobacteria bacterium]